MQKILLVLFGIVLLYGCFNKYNNKLIENKNLEDFFFIDNNKINYTITRRKYCDTCFLTDNVHHLHLKISLTEEQRKNLNRIKYDTWIELLNDQNRDWAANLILYDLHNRSPELFMALKEFKNPIKLWRKNDKISDIEYWKQNIPHQ